MGKCILLFPRIEANDSSSAAHLNAVPRNTAGFKATKARGTRAAHVARPTPALFVADLEVEVTFDRRQVVSVDRST